MRRALAVTLAIASVSPAWAKGKGDDEEVETNDDESTDEDQGSDEDAAPTAKGKEATKPTEEAKGEGEAEDTSDEALRPKQDLSGHDLGTKKRENEFERDRFFVDKIDTDKTEDGTLVQGSITSSSFLYAEQGGKYAESVTTTSNAGPKRMFTELRLQTDFRHISASRWEARIDARARFVNSIDPTPGQIATPDNHVQSGVYGTNEYDLRELWLVHSGHANDVFIGRQFVPDLGAVKFDGIRIDHAFSPKLTLLGFGGLYPVRGSRSVTTDYKTTDATGTEVGALVATGGFGGAYRTINSYGSIGGVAMVPLAKESPRIYFTSTGYVRSGSKLDFYHFALLDVFGAAASASSAHVQLTNLSAGVNGKPNPRLRLTANVNHVDTETLNVQAVTFLGQPEAGSTVVNNEAYIIRLATNAVRGGVSAGLGKNQRVEISTALSYRNRPGFNLTPPGGMPIAISAASSVEVWGGITDRRSIADMRLGIDGSRSFGVGQVAYQRSKALMLHGFASREIADGRGEWEAEVSYSQIEDSVFGMTPTVCSDPTTCFGASNSTLMSGGGQLFYRIKQDWFGIGTLYLLRIANKLSAMEDPTVTGVTGFIRIAKRF